MNTVPYGPPTAQPGRLTSPFGPRNGQWHNGLDWAAPAGSAVVATAAGIVAGAGTSPRSGNWVAVDHGEFVTAYTHLSAIAVAEGQRVTRGQPLGTVGQTGHATGPHVHYVVKFRGVAIDPAGYLSP